jgi:hypothetical protein
MGPNPLMTPAPQLSGNHLVWADFSGVKLFNGAETITLSGADATTVPVISETNVVWRSMSGRICFWDGQHIRIIPRLYAGPASSGNVAVSGSTVAWTDNDSMGMCQLFLWNGTQTIQLSTGMGVDPMSMPQISGANALWKQFDQDTGADSLFFWNGTERIEIASGMIDMMCVPRISGSNAAWVQHMDMSGSQVFFWNGTEAIQITNHDPMSPAGITNIKLSGNTVVWASMNGLYCWNGGDITQVAGGSEQPFDCPYFDVSGSYIAWYQRDGIDEKICFYDGTNTVQVTLPGIQIMPSMSGGTFMMSDSNIAWLQQTESMQPQVYFWNGQTAAPLGDHNMSGTTVMLMGVSGKNAAWYSDGAIFLSRQYPETCAEALVMGYSMDSDVNGDCKVNLSDLAALSNDWLRTFDPAEASHETPWAD